MSTQLSTGVNKSQTLSMLSGQRLRLLLSPATSSPQRPRGDLCWQHLKVMTNVGRQRATSTLFLCEMKRVFLLNLLCSSCCSLIDEMKPPWGKEQIMLHTRTAPLLQYMQHGLESHREWCMTLACNIHHTAWQLQITCMAYLNLTFTGNHNSSIQ